MLIAFKYALIADINQGCIPSLFCITSIYVAVLFYFVFKEAISKPKIIGIGMIVLCIVLIAMDKKEGVVDHISGETSITVT